MSSSLPTAPRRIRPLLAGVAAVVGGILAAGCDTTTAPEDGPGDVAGPPTIEYFLVTSPQVQHGDWTQLRWKASGAEQATVSPVAGSIADPNQAVLSIRPSASVTYTLAVFNRFGSDSATVSLEVRYYAGVYVDGEGGDDGRAGDQPGTALRTLGAALARTGGGGSVYLTVGDYDEALDLTGSPVRIFAGLEPDTFFETEDPDRHTRIVPASGRPLQVNDVQGPLLLRNVTFVAPGGVDVAAEIRDARASAGGFDGVLLDGCRILGQTATTGTALRIVGDSQVHVDRCWVRGGRDLGQPETAAISIEDPAEALVTNSFVDGGRASLRSSGILVDTPGRVRLGFNSICSEITSAGGIGVAASAVRIRSGSPTIGYNILFSRGGGQRVGVLEECASCDPSWLEGNLFIALGVVPYDNFDDTGDATDEGDLNDWQITTGSPGTAAENILYEGAVATNVFRQVDAGDYHLKPTLLGGQPNPAIDALQFGWSVADERYGAVTDDIDEQGRPGSARSYDLGADEL